MCRINKTLSPLVFSFLMHNVQVHLYLFEHDYLYSELMSKFNIYLRSCAPVNIHSCIQYPAKHISPKIYKQPQAQANIYLHAILNSYNLLHSYTVKHD